MGQYSIYVWTAYGLTFALFAGEVLMLLRRRRAGRQPPMATQHTRVNGEPQR